VALTPEEIEGREFPVVSRGYDAAAVDQFLRDVAASYRYRMLDVPPTAPPEGPGEAPSAPEAPNSLARVGQEVAEILRAASKLADTVRNEAETDAAAIRARAELDAADARQAAERDREQAKRLLVRAQEQADAILAEAEEQALSRLTEAQEDARRQSEQAGERAQRQAEQLARAESEAVERLAAVRASLDSAINDLTNDAPGPVLDLTSDEALIKIGGGEPGRAGPGVETRRDPVTHMIRSAVQRAKDHARADVDRLEQRRELGEASTRSTIGF
jgi:DivIVA domain-containing protein